MIDFQTVKLGYFHRIAKILFFSGVLLISTWGRLGNSPDRGSSVQFLNREVVSLVDPPLFDSTQDPSDKKGERYPFGGIVAVQSNSVVSAHSALNRRQAPLERNVSAQDGGGRRNTIVAKLHRVDSSEDLFRSDLLAYPRIDTRNIEGFGFFPGTEFVWGIENTDQGNGFIWKWVDSWCVNRKTLEAEFTGEVIFFLPYSNARDKSFNLVLVRKKGATGSALFELYVCFKSFDFRIDQIQSAEYHLLLSYFSEGDSLATLAYDPETEEVFVFPQSDISIPKSGGNIPIRASTESSISIGLRDFQNRSADVVAVQGNELAIAISSIFYSSVRVPNRLESFKSVRPFWMKRGRGPSATPTWYPRSFRTIEHWPSVPSNSVASGIELQRAISSLKAGERLLIHRGIFSVPARLDVRLRGSSSAPICIEAAAGEQVVITRSDGVENLMDISESEYLVVSGFEFVGGSTGIRIRSSNNLVVENCIIHDVANTGVSANSDNMDGLYFVDNEIYKTSGHAEGFYIGSHDGVARVSNSIIAGNYIHDLGTGSSNQGDGIEVKNCSYGNVIKWNYITSTKYPGITVYSAGNEIQRPNRIEQNAIFDSLDCGIQVCADAVVKNNFIFGNRIGIVSKPFEREPKELEITNNTIVGDGFCLKASQWNSKGIVFCNNLLYSRAGKYFYAGTGLAECSGNKQFARLEHGFDRKTIATVRSDPRPPVTQLDMGNSRFFASSDFFDQERNSKLGIGAFSTALPGDYLDAVAKPKSVFSLCGLGDSSAEVCMFDKVGGKQLG
ncbi:MAG: right-handed parallel beta-helix repeat-containing protein, partial [Pirellula sp.]